MARFDLVREWIVLLIGTATLACHDASGRVVVLCQIFYLFRIFVALALGVGWPTTTASDGLS